MDKTTLAVSPRDSAIKAKYLRRKGLVPGVLYGHGVTNVNLQASAADLAKVYKKAGTSTLIELDLGKDKRVALIHDLDLNPVTDEISHVDFHQVKLDEKIKTDIQLVFTGEPPAVKELDGTLFTNKDSVEVEALPQDLVHEIIIDISGLKTFEDVIHMKDISAPKGITILTDPDELVATVHPPRSEEELAALEEEVKEDIEGVEVEEKGKVEGEGAQGEEGSATTGTPVAESSQKSDN